jgi:ferritin-like metal-binding protein YciE
MKQSSTSSTRGRKKTATGKSTASRGAAATQQNRNRTGASSSSNGPSRPSSNSGRGSDSGRSNDSGRSVDSGRGNSGSRSAANNRGDANDRSDAGSRGDAGARTQNRGNNPGVSGANRGRAGSRSGDSAQHQFTGESHLEKFFLDQLQDIYYAENKIIQSLPKMAEAATTNELKDAFEDHLHQTQRHVKRLEKAFESLGKKAEGKKCEAIEGIAREVDNIIQETEEGTLTRDAALIIAAQKVEHYEIATYGGLVQLAITMNLHDAADLLDKTLVEEEDTDARLTEIAENEINLRAEHEDTQAESSWNAGEQEEEGEGEENENEDEEHPSM